MFKSLLFKNLLIAALICLAVAFKLNNFSYGNDFERIKRDTNNGTLLNNRYAGYKGVLPVESQNSTNGMYDNNTVTISPDDYDNSTLNYSNDTIEIVVFEDYYDSLLSPFLGILPVGLY
uniref:Exported protein n=1 Tax=Strongyloides papillosus TaxID=174720 RepID=A0A0N5BUD9_STREA